MQLVSSNLNRYNSRYLNLKNAGFKQISGIRKKTNDTVTRTNKSGLRETRAGQPIDECFTYKLKEYVTVGS
jgi:hypothetical protein